MNPRTRVLLGILIGVGVLVLGYKTVYPNWIAPLFNYDERIETASHELDRLVAELDKHDLARAKLKEFVSRSGGTDAKDVKNDLQARVNLLIESHNLVSKGVSPSPAKENRKTLLNELGVTVNAEGTLESVVKFLVACEELPQLVRIEEVDLRPLSTSGRNKREDRVTLNCRLAAVVPPAKVLPKSKMDGELNQPETYVRHDGDSDKYAMIWERKPFSEFVPEVKQIVEREDKGRIKTKPPVQIDKPRVPPPPKRDTEAQVDMVAIFGDPGRMVYEVHVSGGKQPEHRDARLSLGDKMDEGKIVLVHPLGVVVSKEDGEFLYPVGEKFKDHKLLADANDYPQIQAMVEHLRARTVAHVEPIADPPADENAQPKDESTGEAASAPVDEPAATPAEADGGATDKSSRRVRPVPRAPVKSPRNRPTMPVPLLSAMKESAIPPAEIVKQDKAEVSEKPTEAVKEESKEPAKKNEPVSDDSAKEEDAGKENA